VPLKVVETPIAGGTMSMAKPAVVNRTQREARLARPVLAVATLLHRL
jgi:hypothetical protein